MKLEYTSYGTAASPDRVSEDSLHIVQRDGCTIVSLADGLGSAKEGGIAARRAVEMIADDYSARPKAWSPSRALPEFAKRINRLFFQESQDRHGSSELLCTLSVIAFESGTAFGLNVGDSPIFYFREGKLTRLSENHALAEPGLEHVLTRTIGLTESLEPFTFELPFEAGDVFLLCSDGVSTVLSEEKLTALLRRQSSARTIVTAAREIAEKVAELSDDTSAIVIEIKERDWLVEGHEWQLEVVPALKTGETIDNYVLARSLQEGERVWLAQRSDGVLQVLKFPSLDARRDDVRRDLFLREAWQATRLESPDFVRSFIPPGKILRYYGMDYVDAPTLRSLLATRPLKAEEAVALAQFLLRAGQFLLRHKLAHGDIKPENILVLRKENDLAFKLLDLGSMAELFSVTSRAGTASYLSPERFHEAPISERTEIYAIGVTLYESLTQSFPYGEIEPFQTPRFDHPPPCIMTLNTAVPAWLDSVIQRSIDPERQRRYQNFSEMAFDLDHPNRVLPYHRKDAPLLERNPLLFYKVLCAILFLTTLFLMFQLSID